MHRALTLNFVCCTLLQVGVEPRHLPKTHKDRLSCVNFLLHRIEKQGHVISVQTSTQPGALVQQR